jgi:hypothetical protein
VAWRRSIWARSWVLPPAVSRWCPQSARSWQVGAAGGWVNVWVSGGLAGGGHASAGGQGGWLFLGAVQLLRSAGLAPTAVSVPARSSRAPSHPTLLITSSALPPASCPLARPLPAGTNYKLTLRVEASGAIKFFEAKIWGELPVLPPGPAPMSPSCLFPCLPCCCLDLTASPPLSAHLHARLTLPAHVVLYCLYCLQRSCRCMAVPWS